MIMDVPIVGGDAGDAVMDSRAVLEMMPHRYPFLLVDRVHSCSPGAEINGYKNITRQDCVAIDGSTATFPDLLVLESLAQLALILTFRSLGVHPTGKERMFFAGIDKATFARRPVAGERLNLSAHVVRMMPSKGIGKFRTCARVDSELAAEAIMLAALRA
ncbi:MAG: 3-hydroxyacyl-[acyl-carrier-protein] dehydratase FabZ [Burkholderiales bacterium]|nr:3-hydroxyacyl-[acyl-carrier-protein] dehydratase FabZ [Burkholderiales bacterium]